MSIVMTASLHCDGPYCDASAAAYADAGYQTEWMLDERIYRELGWGTRAVYVSTDAERDWPGHSIDPWRLLCPKCLAKFDAAEYDE